MRRLAILPAVALALALAVLAGCGADGEPIPPTRNAGVSLLGD